MKEKLAKLIADAAKAANDLSEASKVKTNIIKDFVAENSDKTGLIKENVAKALESQSIRKAVEQIETIKNSEMTTNIFKQVDNVRAKVSNISNDLVGSLLSDEGLYRSLVEYFSKVHSHVGESEAIKAVIDGLAHTKGYGGGGFHRLVDGRHSIIGALESLGKECPDMPYLDRISGALGHLWSDFNSVSGIPVLAFDNMDQFREVCKALHLSPAFLKDVLTVNSTELLNSALTIIPVLFHLNEMQAAEFAKVAARIGIYTAAGNQFEILGSLFSLTMLGKAFFDVYHTGESPLHIITEAGKESGWVGASLASVAVLPFPFSIAGPIFLTIVRSRIETEGLDATVEASSEYFKDLYHWIHVDGLERLKDSLEKLTA